MISGGLLRVCELGILIVGDSGVGKSETTLELISRGHLFISDDVTMISRNEKGTIIGSAPELSRNFMEIRGLGIINICEIFGEQALCPESPVDLIVRLKQWETGKTYDRLGLDFYETRELLGEIIPQITIPVALGRNIATLIEVACKVHLLKREGYHAPHEIAQKLDRALSPKEKTSKVK